ncbi:MAG TPA: two-component system response regulator [Firmicutes bacterium]|nr:two-component system response regulator [Bacillota bacterium]
MARILIVDDSRTTRKILKQILENIGHEVVGEAVNGEEGIARYKELNPDLTTMDITMPIVDGIEALRQIREYDPHAKVLMVSAAGQKHKVLEAMKSGAVEFLLKPFEEEDIVERIKSVLGDGSMLQFRT